MDRVRTGAVRQLPVETVLVAAAAAGAIGLNHDSREVWHGRVVLAALIATPLVFAAHGWTTAQVERPPWQ